MDGMTTIPVGEDFTADDLDALPDDGNRYELVDGQLLVTPSPVRMHQRAVAELFYLLRVAVPPAFEVILAPMDVRLGERLQVQPDVLVVGDRREDRRVESPPLLVVEVLSPGTRGRDQVMKRAAYERSGIPSYWLVDLRGPSLTVLELQDGSYVEVARVVGEQSWTAVRPFPVRVVPAALLR